MAKKQQNVIVETVSGRDGSVIAGGPVAPAKQGTKKKPGRIKFHQYPGSHHEIMAKAIAMLKAQ